MNYCYHGLHYYYNENHIYMMPLIITDHILYVIEGVIPFTNALLSDQEFVKKTIVPENLLRHLIVSCYSYIPNEICLLCPTLPNRDNNTFHPKILKYNGISPVSHPKLALYQPGTGLQYFQGSLHE